MKKVITILVACVLLSTLFAAAAIPASAKKDKSFSYLSMTLASDLIGQDQFVCWVIPWDTIFEDGKQYTFFAEVMFGDDCKQNNGCAYVNMYAYDSLDAAMTTDFDHLVAFVDYARWPDFMGTPTPANEWKTFEYTVDPSIRKYGSPLNEVVKLEAVWISIGFYMASGTINVRELGVKDDGGNIIYSQSFENGLDFGEPYFRHTDDIVPETEGETWSILKSDEKKEESSEEPDPVESSDEPEPVVESSDEPEPVESSDNTEINPVESSDEPAPVESSEEPAPAESSEEPAPVEESSEAPIAESTPAESSQTPAQSDGPGAWLWILIGAVAFAIVLAVVLVLIMKKKKA